MSGRSREGALWSVERVKVQEVGWSKITEGFTNQEVACELHSGIYGDPMVSQSDVSAPLHG